jgi:integrase
LPEVTFHALRHSFVAAAIASEVPIKVIQELVGHASIQMTLDRYGHLLPSSKADAAKAIDDLVNGA